MQPQHKHLDDFRIFNRMQQKMRAPNSAEHRTHIANEISEGENEITKEPERKEPKTK